MFKLNKNHILEFIGWGILIFMEMLFPRGLILVDRAISWQMHENLSPHELSQWASMHLGCISEASHTASQKHLKEG